MWGGFKTELVVFQAHQVVAELVHARGGERVADHGEAGALQICGLC